MTKIKLSSSAPNAATISIQVIAAGNGQGAA
jgi:hypothetical protein